MWNISFGNGSKTLEEVLTRGSNNFDLIRLLAATAVIYGHSFALHSNPVGGDFVLNLIGLNAAELGVKSFFFLSGLLVVNSVLSDTNALHYGIKRLFRIWPALLFLTIVTVFVIGPIMTTQPISVYFSSPELWEFLRRMSSFDIWGHNGMGLPGVFETTPYPVAVNAPLWTLSVEVYAYILIFALFLIGAFRKEAAVVVFGLFLVDSMLPEKVLFYWLPSNSPDFSAIPFCFALGGFMAIYKDQIKVTIPLILGAMLLAVLMGKGAHDKYFTYTALFLCLVYLSAMPAFVNLPRLPDISYGTYLWGWPIQQIVSEVLPNIPFFANLVLTLALVYFTATVSWYLVEKRFLNLARILIDRSKSRIAVQKIKSP